VKFKPVITKLPTALPSYSNMYAVTNAHNYQCPQLPMPSYQYPRLPIPTITNAHGYQCLQLPMPIVTNAHSYQFPQLPMPSYQCSQLPIPTVTNAQLPMRTLQFPQTFENKRNDLFLFLKSLARKRTCTSVL
jgi:hypothetical protein